jgi:hypothetical protein
MTSALMSVRVMVEDVWDEIHLDVAPSTPLGDLKAMALYEAGVTFPPDDYLLKFRGAELQDEDRSVVDAGVVANATLIVLPRRRRPLR